MRYLHFVVGNEPIELEQLKERYYEPGLLSKLMGYNNEPLREIERFEAVKLYPRVVVQPAKAASKTEATPSPKIKANNTKVSPRGVGQSEKVPSASNLTFSITLQNQGGGIGRVPVWLNGKELTGDARPKGAPADAPEITVSLSLEGNRLLLPGTANTLTVRAFNGENAVLSRSTTLDFQAPGERLQGAPHLYAVIAGTSDYQGEELDLPFASNDAEQIAKAVQIASERLLGADKVHITLLTAKNDSTQSKTRTTKSNLVNALKVVQQKATANDILFVYLTGHGIN
ncbi:MAG: caspase family protein, partial [Candidatus Kapaibacteriota bacterium]